ncbi:DNA (cytosine-5-)-methyltransferase [Ferruginibacter sp. HRS2-29]|uniref:DNA (cytosine-5-)-methyltransferase n=1 Tax=Ferruginibacter sp. HRS2-29 TaxID=2487334 RepID=UPI0020CDD8B2|nr:DNA (cytosine-5-)-methyltransferase [Ferruginibacter sp. HRS2-29]MCP9750449.1 DNA (cytosine-5-)-methyltransferase [Ferruginibacter sp. HRS2-29]
MANKIKVVELFAGVGGFRVGLEGYEGKSASSGYKQPFKSEYEIVWSNQWEPSTKSQHASLVYENRFGKKGHSNQDISTVDVETIPEHDMLVGGFPCQDYSVATSLKNSKGLLGKKGVLWWSIHKIISEQRKKPKYLFLENVDRLLISPSKQRGRDFAVILKSLFDLGYAVEWRVINAADYGMPQRRRRIFIIAYLENTHIYKSMVKSIPSKWILNDSIIAESFPAGPHISNISREFELEGDIVKISSDFNKDGRTGLFENAGMMIKGKVYTLKTIPQYEGNFTVLKDVLQNGEVTPEFYIDKEDLDKWYYLKGAKKEIRKNADGFEYHYSEGGMIFPDPKDKPSRTIITGEGGPSASRFKHVIETKNKFRRLSPIELERLNMFPDDHTKLEGVTDVKRAFFMGNALVVGIIEQIGKTLIKRIENGKKVRPRK